MVDLINRMEQQPGSDDGRPYSESLSREAQGLLEKVQRNSSIADPSPANSSEFAGLLFSPDGKKHYTVSHGNIAEGSVNVGTIDTEGRVRLYDNPHGAVDVNTQFANWRFHGSENGKARQFVCNTEMTNGKMFIPGLDGTPTEYDVRMGMLIDKKTGEQRGWVKPPTRQEDGSYTGGSVQFKSNNQSDSFGITIRGIAPRQVALENVPGATFSLRPMGQSIRTRALEGIALRPAEKLADGRVKPGTGGLLSLEQVTKSPDGEDVAIGRRNKDVIVDMVKTGNVDSKLLYDINKSMEKAQPKSTGDALADLRNHIDQRRPTLTSLPNDTSKISGTVKVPFSDEAGKVEQKQLVIANGKLLSADGKTQIGTIDGADGRVSLIDQKSGKTHQINMRDFQGAVWHLEFPKNDGSSEKLDWVSLGSKRGIVSLADLKEGSALEAKWARHLNADSKSTLSQSILNDTLQNQTKFDAGLDKIAKVGVTSEADLKLLVDGSQTQVRVQQWKPQTSQSQPIDLPKLGTDEEAKRANGYLRIGNQSYKIQRGELFDVTHSHWDNQEVVSPTPKGRLRANYIVEFNGQKPMSLSSMDNRVLMEFTKTGETQKHRLVGMGSDRQAAGVSSLPPGLVNVEEIYRQLDVSKANIEKSRDDYFDNRPKSTGDLVNSVIHTDDVLNEINRDTTDSTPVRQEFDTLFRNGFEPMYFPTNGIDKAFQTAQRNLAAHQVLAPETRRASEAGLDAQIVANEAITSAVMTGLTAGSGSVFIGLARAGRITHSAATVGTLGTNAVIGSEVRNYYSSTAKTDPTKLRLSGALEGVGLSNPMLMAAGKFAKTASIAEVYGKSSTLYKGAEYGSRALNPVAQSALFTEAGALRHNAQSEFNTENVALGSIWMAAGSAAGRGSGAAIGRVFPGQGNGMVARSVEQTISGYTYGGMAEMVPALQRERNRVAQENQINPALVNPDFMKGRTNFKNVGSDMNGAGLISAVTVPSPILTTATNAIETRVEFHARRNQPALQLYPSFNPVKGKLPTGDQGPHIEKFEKHAVETQYSLLTRHEGIGAKLGQPSMRVAKIGDNTFEYADGTLQRAQPKDHDTYYKRIGERLWQPYRDGERLPRPVFEGDVVELSDGSLSVKPDRGLSLNFDPRGRLTQTFDGQQTNTFFYSGKDELVQIKSTGLKGDVTYGKIDDKHWGMTRDGKPEIFEGTMSLRQDGTIVKNTSRGIELIRSDREQVKSAMLTQRGLDEYKQYLDIPDADFQEGRVIVDVGAGMQQNLAKDVRAAGSKARVISVDPRFGMSAEEDAGSLTLDWAFRPEVRLEGRRNPEPNTLAAVGDALPFKNNSVDTIYALYSVPTYLTSDSQIKNTLSEYQRVLKPGGAARIYPVLPGQYEQTKSALDSMNIKYEFKQDPPKPGNPEQTNYRLTINR